MKPIIIKNYTKYSLELILSEADKHFTEVLNSVNQNSNRSFYLFGLYLSIIAFSFAKIINQEYLYFILLLGSAVSCMILKNNLFPFKKEIKGSQPSNIILSYFDNFKDENLDKEYLSVLIESYDSSIEINKDLITRMVKNYSNSFKVLISFILIFFIIFLFLFFKCN